MTLSKEQRELVDGVIEHHRQLIKTFQQTDMSRAANGLPAVCTDQIAAHDWVADALGAALERGAAIDALASMPAQPAQFKSSVDAPKKKRRTTKAKASGGSLLAGLKKADEVAEASESADSGTNSDEEQVD